MLKEGTLRRLNMLAERTKRWNDDPLAMSAEEREDLSLMFAATFSNFVEFCYLGMKYLGFSTSEIQAEIAEFMQHGPDRLMVMAQRGEAKSTIAALYAVWCLIQDPSTRVLIVSGGEKQASDVALLIIRLIMHWHLLCWLRPDTSRGDKCSFEHFDVHYSLKGIEKSASVACVGITANLQGKRADLLIADDIETQKNSLTQIMRDQLITLTKEFSAIVADKGGRILYLGTPQTKESVYRTLPARGFTIRIWTSRFPSHEEEEHYLPGTLAPSIIEKMALDPSLRTGHGLDGTRGAMVDPERYSEEELVAKELDYGPEGYSLQFMLDTTLTDAMRTKIKLDDLIVWDGNVDQAPVSFYRSAEAKYEYHCDYKQTPALQGQRMYSAASTSSEFIPYINKIGTIDPAGSGGDEIAFAFGGAAGNYAHVFEVGGYQGGCTEENIQAILKRATELGLTKLWIEKNMGHGTVEQLFLAEVLKLKLSIGIEGFYAVGRKEPRIIDSISPMTRRHKLVWHTSAIETDFSCAKKYPLQKQGTATALYQMRNITYDTGSLSMDDRADAIAHLIGKLNEVIVVDAEADAAEAERAKAQAFVADPMGYGDEDPTGGVQWEFRSGFYGR